MLFTKVSLYLKEKNIIGKVLIGWAEESLVPEKKVSLAGQFYERISDHVETEITATAMAIDNGEDKAIIISCDVTSVNELLAANIREKFALLTDEVDPKFLVFGATHTHTSIKYVTPKSRGVNVLAEFMPEGKNYKNLVETDNSVLDPYEALEFLGDKISSVAKKLGTIEKKQCMQMLLAVLL